MRTLKFKEALAVMRQEQKAPILILIPFYSGIGFHAHGNKQDRINNLRVCLHALQGQGDIIVGTCNKEDYNFVAGLPYDIKTMQIDCEPEYTPYALATVMQKNKSEYSHVCMFSADLQFDLRLKDYIQHIHNGMALMPYRLSNGQVEVPQGPKAYHKLVSGGWFVTYATFKSLQFTKSVPMPLQQVLTFDVAEQCKVVKHKKFVCINLSNEKEKGGGN